MRWKLISAEPTECVNKTTVSVERELTDLHRLPFCQICHWHPLDRDDHSISGSSCSFSINNRFRPFGPRANPMLNGGFPNQLPRWLIAM